MRIPHLARHAPAHPMITLQGAWEVRSGCDLTFDDYRRSDPYDASRKLTHLITLTPFQLVTRPFHRLHQLRGTAATAVHDSVS
jgi:hypothetical protein